MERDRYIIRQANWWEIVRISHEGRQVVVATAPTRDEAAAEAEKRTLRDGVQGGSAEPPPAGGSGTGKAEPR